jgi:uncharacterized protein (TIGR03000 family)
MQSLFLARLVTPGLLILAAAPTSAQTPFAVPPFRPFFWEAQWWQNPSWNWHWRMGYPPYPAMPYPGAYNYMTNAYYPPNYSSQSSLRTGSSNSEYGSYPAPESARTGSSKEQADLPHPAGHVRVPPADAGVIRLRVPDKLASVSFNGQVVSSVGSERDFVTPTVSPGQKLQYDIAVSWGQGNQRTTVERVVEVGPGQITSLDLPRVVAAVR